MSFNGEDVQFNVNELLDQIVVKIICDYKRYNFINEMKMNKQIKIRIP